MSSFDSDSALGIPNPRRTCARLGAIEHTDSGGSGRALVTLHGGMGGYDQSWLLARTVVENLGAWRVIALSRPGYLGTPVNVAPSAEAQADLIASLLDELGMAKACVAAVSGGGPVAWHFALRHPDRCDGLFLASAASGPVALPPGAARKLQLMRLLALVPGVPGLLRRRAARNPAASAARSIGHPALAAQTLAHPHAGPLFTAVKTTMFDRLPERVPGTINDLTNYASMPAIPFARAGCPVSLVHGLADPIVPPSHARSIVRELPAARLLGVEGAGHFVIFSHLEAVRAAFADFAAAPRR